MSSHILVAALLLAVAGAGTVAQAQSVAEPPLPAQPEARPANRPGDRNCIRDTGSLIRVKKGQCLPVAGDTPRTRRLRRPRRRALHRPRFPKVAVAAGDVGDAMHTTAGGAHVAADGAVP